MGVYGLGKSYNLQYAQRQVNRDNGFKPRMQQQLFPQGFQQTTTIEYDNGLGGFWGGMAGFLNGLSGNFSAGWNNMYNGFGNMFGGRLFGGGMFGMNNSFGLNNNFGYNRFGQTQTNVNCLQNLKTMGPGWTIVQNPDGTFTAKKGDTTIQNKSYDEAMELIMKSNTNEVQGDKKPDNEDTVKPDNDGTVKPDNDGTVKPDNDDTVKPDNDGTVKPDNDGTVKPDENDTTTSPGSAKGWSNASASDISGRTRITIHDNSGKTRDINASFSITKPAAEAGGFPKEISVSGRRYQLVEGSSNPARYKSVGDANNNEYRLEKNTDGSLALNQYEGDSGYGIADIGASRTSSASNASNT